jgi:WD40 repeat protein
MRPYCLEAGVLLVMGAFQVSQPTCHAQQPKAVLQVEGGIVWSVAFSPDGKMVAAACQDGQIELWEVATEKRRATLRGRTKTVMSVAFSADGKVLASGGA